MNKKTRKLFAWCLVVAMLITQMLFTNIAFAATDSYKGNDRFSTAFSIVDKGWTTSDVAVIARGDVDGSDLADALAAAPLAYANGKAPVFITQKDVLTDGIMQRLTALGVKKVFIVGGTGAVSQAVEDTLAAKLGAANVTRVSGASRVETSLEVAKLVAPTPTKVVLVNGYASADALSAAPLAAAQGMPVLFVENKDTLSDAVKAYIGTAKVYVVGGTGVVSDAVKTAVSGERVAGDDRFATNNAVLTTFAPDYTKVYLAKGADANAIDALAGAPLAALTNSPIVFVDDQGSVISAKATLTKNLLAGSTIIGLGGLVTNDVLAFVDALRPQAVNVDSVSKLSATLNNPVSETYSDVVYNGTLGQILVKAVDKSGKPVANVPVVYEITATSGGEFAYFEDSVAYTNNDGVAIGFLNSNNKITDGPITVAYKTSVVGKDVDPVEGKVRFAQLSVGTASVTTPDIAGGDDLTPKKGADGQFKHPMTTYNMNVVDAQDINDTATEYVASQQVSGTGTTAHAVTFQVTPKMSYLTDNTVKTTDTYSKTVGWKSGAYHPYDSITSDHIDVPAGLKYATIYLKNLQLDENAVLDINFYNTKGTFMDDVVVNGPIDDASRAVQIPSSVLGTLGYFTVTVKTAGQVNTTLNGGVEVDRVEGVFQVKDTVTSKDVDIPGAKIAWSATDVVYSETKPMNVGATTYKNGEVVTFGAASFGINVTNAVKYTYKVPVFPFTGDAVVTAYDSNNKVLKYYVIPTVNNGDNENILYGNKAILASKNEVNDMVGTVTSNEDGSEVTVNSEKVGVTLVKGVIDIPGISKDVLNATNAIVYTSVNWAPLPKDLSTAANSKLFALQGQKVNVVAQLVDENGNPATEEGQTVTLEPFDGATGHDGVGLSTGFKATTDSNGQAKWVLSSPAVTFVKGLKATNDNYDVVLTVGSTDVTEADLYWISAELTHQPVLDDGDSVDEALAAHDTDNPMTADEAAAYVMPDGSVGYHAVYNVGDPVEFGFKAIGKVKPDTDPTATDVVTDVTLANVPVDFTKVTGTVGSAEKVTDKPYVFLAKSDKAGTEMVDAKIGKSTDGITVQYSTDNGDTYFDGAFVGTGTSSIYNKYRLNIDWQAEGEQLSFVVPQGSLGIVNKPVKVYVKLTDSLGNPLQLAGTTKSIDYSITFVPADGHAATTTPVAQLQTDANGVAFISITALEAGQSTVQIEYNGETQYYSINFQNSDRDFALVSAGVNTSGTNDVITVTLSNDINPESVVARQFTVTSMGTTPTVYAVKSVEVEGNQVKLTLADSNAHLYNKELTQYQVSYAPFTQFDGDNAGIEYNLVDLDGNTLGASNVTFVTPSNVSVKSVAVAGGVLTAKFYNAVVNGTPLPTYVVDSNGQVYVGTYIGSEDGGTTAVYTFAVDPADFYTVYCNGQTYTK